MTEWHRVLFSDESRFCLSSDSRRVRVWRRRGERSNPAAIVERPTVRQRGIMVWGAIAYDSRSPLLRIQGTMTAQRYVDDVLRPVTLPYLQGVPNTLYQQDNARPHTARISQQALQDVQMLPWPPYSPDLSPIEHVWDIIGRRLHALPQPRSEDELWQMWLKNIKNPTGRLFRWSLRFSVYDYQVKYIKGTKQLEADLLSRNPFCDFLDATQLRMYQSELRDNSKSAFNAVINDKPCRRNRETSCFQTNPSSVCSAMITSSSVCSAIVEKAHFQRVFDIVILAHHLE
ncbi:Transposase [Cordylochernes scorpioides]|uniref:Transposase n=1 Tax=Cordylochernes scorpioides TaxID=51811 RepID=A0ABY6LUZ9_9ARAC|nr:Transposase [Cordylochernes scorpioides]